MSAPPKPSRPKPEPVPPELRQILQDPTVSWTIRPDDPSGDSGVLVSGPRVGPDDTRLARQEALLTLWQSVPVTELLADLSILIHLIQVRDDQDHPQ